MYRPRIIFIGDRFGFQTEFCNLDRSFSISFSMWGPGVIPKIRVYGFRSQSIHPTGGNLLVSKTVGTLRLSTVNMVVVVVQMTQLCECIPPPSWRISTQFGAVGRGAPVFHECADIVIVID